MPGDPVSSSISLLPTPRCAEPHFDLLGGFIKTCSGYGAILKRGRRKFGKPASISGRTYAAHLATEAEAAWFQLPRLQLPLPLSERPSIPIRYGGSRGQVREPQTGPRVTVQSTV